uniref:Uncharacterized protein n=1 Tax=Arcella intermedia TaxID=1963864 RepID=A0A6B2LHP6_9EUKA
MHSINILNQYPPRWRPRVWLLIILNHLRVQHKPPPLPILHRMPLLDNPPPFLNRSIRRGEQFLCFQQLRLNSILIETYRAILGVPPQGVSYGLPESRCVLYFVRGAFGLYVWWY